MPSFRQVGHCSLAVLPQPGVSQVPKVDIFQEHEDFGRAVTTVTPTLSLTTSTVRLQRLDPKAPIYKNLNEMCPTVRKKFYFNQFIRFISRKWFWRWLRQHLWSIIAYSVSDFCRVFKKRNIFLDKDMLLNWAEKRQCSSFVQRTGILCKTSGYIRADVFRKI
jgi:hypothetical protein